MGPRWIGPYYGPRGVWAREFTGGLVSMNLKGSRPQILTAMDLGGDTLWKRISGANVTNATGGITLQLQDYDGIILLRHRPAYGKIYATPTRHRRPRLLFNRPYASFAMNISPFRPI